MSRKEGNYEMYTRKQPTGFVEYPENHSETKKQANEFIRGVK
jgi:hypothetical protein